MAIKSSGERQVERLLISKNFREVRFVMCFMASAESFTSRDKYSNLVPNSEMI